jgi:8-oxo-dGTP pyrophosphatase MutT (NUDIX family)
MKNSIQEQSFGVIPLYKDAEGLKVFLIHQYGSGGDTLWTFPKGRGEKGETSEETARRELNEETGLSVGEFVGGPISTSYTFLRNGEGIEKTSSYFLGYVTDPTFQVQESEVKEAVWLLPEEAREKLTFPDYKVLLDDVLALLDK